MKILYLNYSTTNLATMIRCLELARAASQNGHDVTLCYMHRRFSPPAFFSAFLRSFEHERFRVLPVSMERARLAAPVEQPTPPDGAGANPPGQTAEPSERGRSRSHAAPHSFRRRRALSLIRQAATSMRYVPREMHLIKELRPDVVVARPDQIFSFLVSTLLTHVPLVISTDGPVEELATLWGVKSRLPVIADTWRLWRADALLVVSSVCYDLLRSKGIPKDRLFLCPNGTDPEFFKPSASGERQHLRSRLGLEGAHVLGFSGNQVAYHGVGELLKTCVPLLQSRPLAKVLVIGALKAEQALELSELPGQIRSRIVFTGALPYTDMPAYIDCADIMVMPYPKLELFFFSPMKMFEAMAMGKPIVASRQGQVCEFLKDLPCAFLYDPDEPGALLVKLEEALAALEAGITGAAGRELLLREHTWLQRGETLASACEYALANRGRRVRAGEVAGQ